MMRYMYLTLLTASMLVCAQDKGATKTAQDSAANKSNDEQQLLQLQSDLIAAENRNDAGLFEKLVSDDWVHINASGQSRLSKKEVLANLREHEGEKAPYSVAASDTAIHLFGETAVLTFKKQYTNSQGGVASENQTYVLTRQTNGRWLLRFSQLTK